MEHLFVGSILSLKSCKIGIRDWPLARQKNAVCSPQATAPTSKQGGRRKIIHKRGIMIQPAMGREKETTGDNSEDEEDEIWAKVMM